jgi:hypothetical protein
MKLYYVAHTEQDNLDLFVIADNVQQVEEIWQAHYNVNQMPEFIFQVTAAAPVGYHEKPHALEWHGTNLPRVGGFRGDPRG